jgi:hypothetical protein
LSAVAFAVVAAASVVLEAVGFGGSARSQFFN